MSQHYKIALNNFIPYRIQNNYFENDFTIRIIRKCFKSFQYDVIVKNQALTPVLCLKIQWLEGLLYLTFLPTFFSLFWGEVT